ncbi:MAG: M23 family metallopeptidase [Pseudomonadota bacterium]
MNIIIVGKNGQNAKNISLIGIILLMLSPLLIIAFIFLLYPLIVSNSTYSSDNQEVLQLLKKQQDQINNLTGEIQQQKNNVILKLAQMQSGLIKLDSLGKKLVKVARLKTSEFDFSKKNSMGGPVDKKSTKNSDHKRIIAINEINIDQRLSEILRELSLKSQQLYLIEALYDNKLYRESVTPQGKPTKKGWISSFYGIRKDPFTGKNSQHNGIDVAAKANSRVIATATGIVSWSGKRSGYGNLVEINHGNGLFTRYGHCNKLLVEVGQRVEQGDAIATIGSTGRSTGPHIHYEVLKNNVKINPIKYVRKKRNTAEL